MDSIVIPDIPLRVRVGVSPEEREEEQDISVDVELALDLARAGESDDLALTVDYDTVCEVVTRLVRSRAFHLVEAIAEGCARAVLAHFAVANEVRIRVRKSGALRSRGVPYAQVEVVRRRG